MSCNKLDIGIESIMIMATFLGKKHIITYPRAVRKKIVGMHPCFSIDFPAIVEQRGAVVHVLHDPLSPSDMHTTAVRTIAEVFKVLRIHTFPSSSRIGLHKVAHVAVGHHIYRMIIVWVFEVSVSIIVTNVSRFNN